MVEVWFLRIDRFKTTDVAITIEHFSEFYKYVSIAFLAGLTAVSIDAIFLFQKWKTVEICVCFLLRML